MVSTLDFIGLESTRVIDPFASSRLQTGATRYGVVNFDEKRNGIKIFLVDFVKMLLIHLVTFNPFHKRKQIKG